MTALLAWERATPSANALGLRFTLSTSQDIGTLLGNSGKFMPLRLDTQRRQESSEGDRRAAYKGDDIHRGSRALKVALVGAIEFGGTATGAAWARTGYDANAKSVVFYFGETGGGPGDSNNFAGYGSVKLCTDGDNSGGGNTYGAQYRHNLGGRPDETVREAYPSYGQAAVQSSSFSTSSNANYHTNATWSGVPSAPDSASGFSASRMASLSCPYAPRNGDRRPNAQRNPPSIPTEP